MGPTEEATDNDRRNAYELGRLIAKENWILLSGGVKAGVMEEVNKGAKEAGGLTIGIIPRLDSEIAEGVDIPIITDMGSARNNINVLSSDIVIACGIGPGTASEIALALQRKANKPVILINDNEESKKFFKSLRQDLIHIAKSPEEAITIARRFT